MKLTERFWLPVLRSVPDGGVYTYVPVTVVPLAIATALSCVVPSGVPAAIGASGPQLIVVVAGIMVKLTPDVKVKV